jgi:hypothetical protein
LLKERHGHRIAIIGYQEMQVSVLDKKRSRRNLRHLRWLSMCKIEDHPFGRFHPREGFSEMTSQISLVAFIEGKDGSAIRLRKGYPPLTRPHIDLAEESGPISFREYDRMSQACERSITPYCRRSHDFDIAFLPFNSARGMPHISAAPRN